MKARAFLYRRPRDINEAVALLGDNAGDAQVLAGGQSLMPTLNMRLSSPGMLIDINRIGALAGIADRGVAIRIGALVRHADVLESDLLAERLPLLALAIPHVAHMAVRNRGTCCGSLALADPSAEMPAVAVALDASIVLQKRGATRTVAARDFFLGLYETVRNDDELIVEAMFPAAKPDEVFGFSELSRRHGDFATVGVAVRARKTPRGLEHFEIVFFGSEPTPLLSPTAAKLTLDTGVAEEAVAEMAHDIANDMQPIDSHQGRGDTKRRQAAVLLQRVLQDMIVRAADV
jgi:aerobic carbon-monoxide dehydrogenase medium subunit